MQLTALVLSNSPYSWTLWNHCVSDLRFVWWS